MTATLSKVSSILIRKMKNKMYSCSGHPDYSDMVELVPDHPMDKEGAAVGRACVVLVHAGRTLSQYYYSMCFNVTKSSNFNNHRNRSKRTCNKMIHDFLVLQIETIEDEKKKSRNLPLIMSSNMRSENQMG